MNLFHHENNNADNHHNYITTSHHHLFTIAPSQLPTTTITMPEA
jgi:hypothetical protein